jgi:flagellar protein FliL
MAVKDDKKTTGDKKKGDKDKKNGKDGGKKKKIIIIVVVLAVLGFVAFKILGPKPDPNAPPVPGTIVEVEAITINLSGAHYLKLALGLQTAAGGGHGTEISGALALNAAIEVFHGKSMTELSTAEGREKYRKELAEKLREAYHDAVYDVYYTSFVMQ